MGPPAPVPWGRVGGAGSFVNSVLASCVLASSAAQPLQPPLRPFRALLTACAPEPWLGAENWRVSNPPGATEASRTAEGQGLDIP